MTVETKVVPKKRTIRYALSDADGSRISYFQGVTRPGARGPWSEDEDNPLSPNFRSLEGRGERGRARWWALHGRKTARPTHGEFDEKPAQSR